MNDVFDDSGAPSPSKGNPSPHAEHDSTETDRANIDDAGQNRGKIATFACPIIGFVAFSGTGKTTLLRHLLPLLKQSGLRIGVVKHAHHAFEIDTPGKDSYELRKAGADRMLIGSRKRFALMVEKDSGDEPDLRSMLGELGHESLDLVLVEGFKHERYDKIELHRPSLGKPPMYPDDPYIVAIATDAASDLQADIPILDLNSPAAIANFVIEHFGISIRQPRPCPSRQTCPSGIDK